MKIFGFLFLTAAIFCFCLIAQTNRVDEARQNTYRQLDTLYRFSSSIIRECQFKKIDAFGNITIESISQTWDGSSWLNSIKITSLYDSNDRLFEEIEQYWDDATWKNQNKYLFDYGNNDSLSEKTSQYWSGTNWMNYERLYYLYDVSLNIVEQGKQDWENNSWVNEDRTLFTYDASNNKLEELNQSWFINSWKNAGRKTFTYNLNNSVTEIIEQFWSNSQWENFKRTARSYYPDNNLSEEIFQNWNNNNWLNSQKNSYTYPSSYSYEKIQQFWNISLLQWVNDYKSTFTFNSNNYLLEILYQDWDGSSFINQFLTSYTYDLNNNRTEWIDQEWGGSYWLNDFRVVYSFDTNNLLTEELRQTGSGLNWVNTNKRIFYYDENDHLTELLEQDWDGMGWLNSYREQINYIPSIILTYLTTNLPAGSQILQVTTTNGFSIGDNIVINPGGENEETNTITGIGSIILQTPLQYDHYSGETVANLSTTPVEETIKPLPNMYTLSQNYPNPFNPSTKISWQLPVGSHQTLKVYDVLGNEVATLVNEEKPAGSYETEFSAEGLSSGIYFYKLQARNFVETKKMILLK